jgi:hypothetical protein
VCCGVRWVLSAARPRSDTDGGDKRGQHHADARAFFIAPACTDKAADEAVGYQCGGR